MKRISSILLAASLFAFAVPALAKDICVSDGATNTYVFSSPKKLKPGRAITVNGIAIASGAPRPFNGSASMRSDGTTVHVGIFVHGLANFSTGYTMGWSSDATFAGLAYYDNDGDTFSNGTLMLSTVDCSTVTIP